MKGLTTMTTTTTTCARCEGSGEVWNYAGDPDAGDLRACPDCHGSGDVPLRTPDATARRESAPPHGCTGVRGGEREPPAATWTPPGDAPAHGAGDTRGAAREKRGAETLRNTGETHNRSRE